jgi:hypothetical protein
MRVTALYVCAFFVALQCSTALVTGLAPGRDREAPEAAAVVKQRAEFIPRSQAERLHDYLKSAFGVEGVLRSSAGAAISQWNNTPSEWGQGAGGYARRFGSSYAQYITQETLMYGASSALHEDNRYIPSTETAFGPRLKYALTSSFLARRDDGVRRLSYSRLGSYLATAFLSREWQPPSESRPRNAMTSFATAMGATVGFNVAREFLPKILRRHRD